MIRTLLIVLAALSALLALLTPALTRTASPTLAVLVALAGERDTDPWGQPWGRMTLGDGTTIFVDAYPYSFGPDQVDDSGHGDDLHPHSELVLLGVIPVLNPVFVPSSAPAEIGDTGGLAMRACQGGCGVADCRVVVRLLDRLPLALFGLSALLLWVRFRPWRGTPRGSLVREALRVLILAAPPAALLVPAALWLRWLLQVPVPAVLPPEVTCGATVALGCLLGALALRLWGARRGGSGLDLGADRLAAHGATRS